jgi:hypothetical protein
MKKLLQYALPAWLVLMALLACSPAFVEAANPDACEAQVPIPLREVLQKQFPGYRLAKVSDYSGEDIEQHKTHFNGNPCLAAATADADGDGFVDFSFLIVNRSKHTLLVAARNLLGKTWKLVKLSDFGNEGPGRSYVETIDAGTYADMYASDKGPSDYTPEPGRVRRYKAIHSGFIAGGIESSGAAYFYDGKRWVHLWLSD